MGLSASQGRLLLLTARRSDLEFRAQQISQKRLNLSQQLEQISIEYEDATSDRQMKIGMYGTDEGGNAVTRTSNLTYATLISGLKTLPSEKSGIATIEDNSGNNYASNTKYRLMDPSGAIVIASVDEIPGSAKTTTTESSATKASTYARDKDTSSNCIYQPTTEDPNGKVTKGDYYVCVPENSALAKLISEHKNPAAIELSKNKTWIRVNIGTEKEPEWKYYNLADGKEGEERTASTENFTWTNDDKNCHVVTSENKIPQSTVTEESTEDYSRAQGADGVWTLYDTNGLPVQRYIVDTGLDTGSSDPNGATDGPNYLQDCIRNGKYLIQKYVTDDNTDEGYRWSNVAWDATANISDSYYTENDDAAKAKYDRLQTQIQAQDKKLELELDNIETQRNAVTTEIESVEKVIQEDIESTFKTFG